MYDAPAGRAGANVVHASHGTTVSVLATASHATARQRRSLAHTTKSAPMNATPALRVSAAAITAAPAPTSARAEGEGALTKRSAAKSSARKSGSLKTPPASPMRSGAPAQASSTATAQARD